MSNAAVRTETATLAGGCFWCIEAIFKELKGVLQAVSGYTGGRLPDPTYDRVSAGNTGHAEAVQVTFDPSVISFRDIVEIFFSVHDPTTLNRQGADVGTQYRSTIFYHDEEQKAVAEQVIGELNKSGLWKTPIVTEVAPLEKFYAAEDYHQEYFNRNPEAGYCQFVISPKMAKFRQRWAKLLKRAPA